MINKKQTIKDKNGYLLKATDTGFDIAPRQKDDPKLPQIYLLSSGEVTPFLLTVRDETESPVWSMQLKAVFSIPLERTEVSRER